MTIRRYHKQARPDLSLAIANSANVPNKIYEMQVTDINKGDVVEIYGYALIDAPDVLIGGTVRLITFDETGKFYTNRSGGVAAVCSAWLDAGNWRHDEEHHKTFLPSVWFFVPTRIEVLTIELQVNLYSSITTNKKAYVDRVGIRVNHCID